MPANAGALAIKTRGAKVGMHDAWNSLEGGNRRDSLVGLGSGGHGDLRDWLEGEQRGEC